MQTETVKISRLKNNTGQVPGLPKNPRFIKDDKFRALVRSLQDDPEMMELREIIAYDNSGELVVICGNMRLRGMRELGMSDAWVKILPQDTPIKKLKAYAIKDNVPFGEHDWDALANDWDSDELTDLGLDIPGMIDDDEEQTEQTTEHAETCPVCGHKVTAQILTA